MHSENKGPIEFSAELLVLHAESCLPSHFPCRIKLAPTTVGVDNPLTGEGTDKNSDGL